MKYYLGSTDWKEWKTILEEKMIHWVNPEAPIYNDVLTSWDNIRYTLQQATREHIPKKIITKHSKQFWNKTLTELSFQIRTLSKVFMRTSTPANMAALNMAPIEIKSEMRVSASKWTRSRLNEIKNKDMAIVFGKSYKKCFPVKKMTCLLL